MGPISRVHGSERRGRASTAAHIDSKMAPIVLGKNCDLALEAVRNAETIIRGVFVETQNAT
jgi:hypothetical protein